MRTKTILQMLSTFIDVFNIDEKDSWNGVLNNRPKPKTEKDDEKHVFSKQVSLKKTEQNIEKFNVVINDLSNSLI